MWGRLQAKKDKGKKECQPVPVCDYIKQCDAVWGINAWTDSDQTHPTKICHLCARYVRHHDNGTRAFGRAKAHPSINWGVMSHPRTGICAVCNNFLLQSRGIRVPKLSWASMPLTELPSSHSPPIGLPFSLNEDNIFLYHDTSSRPSISLDIVGRSGEEKSMLTCSICLCIVHEPVECPCQHNFCSTCLTQYFQYVKSTTVPCPICALPISFHHTKPSPNYITIPLRHVSVCCYSCGTLGMLADITNHICKPKVHQIVIPCPCPSCVSKEPTPEPTSPSATTTDAVSSATQLLTQLAKQHTKGSKLPPSIERMTDRWIHLKLQCTEQPTVTLQTGGTPVQIQRVVTPRKSSDDVCKSYQRRRSLMINEFRCRVSGGTPEVHHDKSKFDAELDVDSSIAMMRQIHLTWEGLTTMRRYMTSIGVSISSERQMRRRRDELVDNCIEGKMMPLIFKTEDANGSGGFIAKETPFVFVKDVPELVIEFLERHHELQNLTWHDGLVPANEIWIKIGGDKGGASMKMFFQIVNVPTPNRSSNTVVFAAFHGPDSPTNMSITMEPFISQIERLKNMTWRGFTFRLLFFGDCELICKSYGILACNSIYACPVCEEPKARWQVPLTERLQEGPPASSRTLESLHRDYVDFQTDGSRKERSKLISKSVVRPPLFPIEPRDIAMPTLHISLGIYQKIYNKLEESCNHIDNLIYHNRIANNDPKGNSTNFHEMIQKKLDGNKITNDEIQEKHDQIEELEEEIPLALTQANAEAVKSIFTAIHQLRRDKIKLEASLEDEMKFGTGPITAALDIELNQNNVSRQAWHGNSFCGNHVQQCCKPDVIKSLVGVPMKVLKEVELTDDEMPLAVYKQATEIERRFTSLMSTFAEVHRGINHGGSMTEQEIAQLETSVQDFMETFRHELPTVQISLKLHFLEDHVIPQIRQFRAGLGKLNEQGGESKHGVVNREEKANCNLKRQPLKFLTTVVRNVLVACLPNVLCKMLQRKRRCQEE